MAKIGNEAKLILKLATDRVTAKYSEVMNDKGRLVDYQRGYADAYHCWVNVLQIIVSELESK